jgi:16S rRNA (cytosine967-C5)-methyltransferase
MKHFSHLNTAVAILKSYNGEIPFHHFLRSFFSASKKYGSRDRKQIGQICYSWFRTGLLFEPSSLVTNLPAACFLCAEQSNEFLEAVAPDLNAKAGVTTAEKLAILGIAQPVIFPPGIPLSEGIDRSAFERAHLRQPLVFLRIRPGQRTAVVNRLSAAGIAFQSLNESTLSIPAAVRIEDILELNKQVVVQDLSSQETASLLRLLPTAEKKPVSLWDCCAASGGKSIMAIDTLGKVELTVTDIRESILANLRNRFAQAGISKFRARTADLANGKDPFPDEYFDLVIADVPCTGAGTWGRTPEQMRYFDKSSVAVYAARQRSIATNAAKKIVPNGHLLYITCSVFREENEAVIDQLTTNAGLRVIEKRVFPGYNKRADTMFAALLQKG